MVLPSAMAEALEEVLYRIKRLDQGAANPA